MIIRDGKLYLVSRTRQEYLIEIVYYYTPFWENWIKVANGSPVPITFPKPPVFCNSEDIRRGYEAQCLATIFTVARRTLNEYIRKTEHDNWNNYTRRWLRDNWLERQDIKWNY